MQATTINLRTNPYAQPLLVGPLAEAKYVAMRDGELINPRLVNLNALHYYGGTSDLDIINEYLQGFIVVEAVREKKISDLFLQAFSFINDRSNWLAITVLASYILAGRMNIIEGGAHIANGIPEGAIGNVRPDLHRNFNPWDRISEPSGLREMLAEASYIPTTSWRKPVRIR